jgi:hypothetical protein
MLQLLCRALKGRCLATFITALGVVGMPRAAVSGAPDAPTRLVGRCGDRSVALHWDAPLRGQPIGYNVYRATRPEGPFSRANAQPVSQLGFADLEVANGTACYYVVRAFNAIGESADSATLRAEPRPFRDDDDFLELLEATAFDFFWYEANPANGLIRDRSTARSFSSIAAVGFGLTGIGIGIDHGWITRREGAERTLATLRTFWEGPQGPAAANVIGYHGWFYHFLNMDTATRYRKVELSSIDTALFLAGALYARQYFDRSEPPEPQIRGLAEAIYQRVDWNWMANGGKTLTMGYHPESGFLASRWVGYNEASILYIMGLGAATNPLPTAQWDAWVRGYDWRSFYGYSFVAFAPLFGHQYSQCWLDLRGLADAYMRGKQITYFENSRRATLAQRQYAMANPGHFPAYSSNLWGFTACDGPGGRGYHGYAARGAPPPENDDGTIAPTAPGGSLPFTPGVSLAALRHMYDTYRRELWTCYGFRDAFNVKANWWDPDVLGIDQGPILIMAENYRTQRVWDLFMRSPEIQRGLHRAGFQPVRP